MNLRDLKYLVALEECQHFGKAAEICFVSQPALSMQIKKLEQTLGISLIERGPKSFLLTEAGKMIAQKAKMIIVQTEEIKSIAKLSKDIFAGEFKIGIIPTLAAYLLPHIMPLLSKQYPNIKFYLVEMQTEFLIEKLRLGEIDTAFLAAPLNEPDLSIEPLFEENFFIAVYKNHPLAKQKTLKLSDLKNKEMLLLEEGHCMRDSTLEICARVKAHEDVNFRGTSLETLRHMVGANAGITFIPALACLPHRNITYIPIEQCNFIRKILLASRIGYYRNTLVKTIAQQIKKMLPSQKSIKVLG